MREEGFFCCCCSVISAPLLGLKLLSAPKKCLTSFSLNLKGPSQTFWLKYKRKNIKEIRKKFKLRQRQVSWKRAPLKIKDVKEYFVLPTHLFLRYSTTLLKNKERQEPGRYKLLTFHSRSKIGNFFQNSKTNTAPKALLP